MEARDLKKVATLGDDGHAKNIIICHNTNHNPKEHMVSDGNALKAHLGHGDYIGACGAPVIKSCQSPGQATEEQKHSDKKDKKS